MASSSPTPAAISSSSFASKYLSWVPLLTPAVRSNEWSPKGELILVRSMVFFVAGAILINTAAKWIPPLSRLGERLNHVFLARSSSTWRFVIALACSALGVALFSAYFIFEERRAYRVIDQSAVNEYLNPDRAPSNAARRHIETNLSAVQLLVAQGGDINRRDESGYDLTFNLMNLDLFKFLVDNGFYLSRKEEGKRLSDFQLAVRGGAPYLQYLIERGLVHVADFTPNAQVELWTYAHDAETIQLLKNCGFDINVRNEHGQTPLAELSLLSQGGSLQDERLELFRQQGAVM